MEELLKEVREEFARQRKQERKLLGEIADITSVNFAEEAAEALDSRKHLYGFETYLRMLEDLRILLLEGISERTALESIQSGYRAEEILTMLRLDRRFLKRK